MQVVVNPQREVAPSFPQPWLLLVAHPLALVVDSQLGQRRLLELLLVGFVEALLQLSQEVAHHLYSQEQRPILPAEQQVELTQLFSPPLVAIIAQVPQLRLLVISSPQA